MVLSMSERQNLVMLQTIPSLRYGRNSTRAWLPRRANTDGRVKLSERIMTVIKPFFWLNECALYDHQRKGPTLDDQRGRMKGGL
jgi:hypothetical protein